MKYQKDILVQIEPCDIHLKYEFFYRTKILDNEVLFRAWKSSIDQSRIFLTFCFKDVFSVPRGSYDYYRNTIIDFTRLSSYHDCPKGLIQQAINDSIEALKENELINRIRGSFGVREPFFDKLYNPINAPWIRSPEWGVDDDWFHTRLGYRLNKIIDIDESRTLVARESHFFKKLEADGKIKEWEDLAMFE